MNLQLSTSYDLQYDPDFCAVRNPANIWALVQVRRLPEFIEAERERETGKGSGAGILSCCLT